MNLNFEIGVRTKWLIIGLLILSLGGILGTIGGWEKFNFTNIMGVVICIVGGLVSIISLFAVIVHDIEYNG